MNDNTLTIGSTHTATLVVRQQHLACNIGSGDLPVLATPVMMTIMENAAMQAVAPLLDPHLTTVGGKIEATHLRPTAEGHTITATAQLMAIDGKKLLFSITASDETGIIGEGTHLRFIVDRQRFMAKV